MLPGFRSYFRDWLQNIELTRPPSRCQPRLLGLIGRGARDPALLYFAQRRPYEDPDGTTGQARPLRLVQIMTSSLGATV
jgi:hypothetical protein